MTRTFFRIIHREVRRVAHLWGTRAARWAGHEELLRLRPDATPTQARLIVEAAVASVEDAP